MATALNKEMKREVMIKDKPFTLTLGPTGLKLTLERASQWRRPEVGGHCRR